MNKIKIHDGIVGVVITIGSLLGFYIDSMWLLMLGIIGITMVQSAFTGFCPLYFILNKTDIGN